MKRDAATVCLNPCTGECIGESVLHSESDVAAAMEKARAAQPAWAALPVAERARFLLRVRDYVVENADEISRVISADNGKTLTDAMATEVFPAAIAAGYYARKAKGFLADRIIPPGNMLLSYKLSTVVQVPYGVVGIISPWNYPFAIPFSEVVMALLAGNTVLLKCATETQMAGRILAQCFEAAEFPQGVFCYLNLPGRKAGAAFLAAGVDKLFFTGSVPVGKELMKKASETLTPLCLELGGNDPMLVFPDADLCRAAGGAAWAGFQNCGQSCGGVERIYVHEAVYDAFLEKLAKKVSALRVGADSGCTCDMGGMTTKRQQDTVKAQVEEALEKGARIYAQSQCPEGEGGNFMPAIILVDVNHDMQVMKEETFGPVVGVMKVSDMDEAVRLANDSNLGLSASVWSRDRAQAKALARKIRAGAVMINDHLASHGFAETPWGGFKESGIGRTHGEIGFSEMTQPQVIVDDLLSFFRRNFWWYPQDQVIYQGVKGFVDLCAAKGIPARALGGARMARAFIRSFVP